MKNYINISFWVGILILWSSIQTQAQVWPGDANRDSTVNNFDVLYLGKGFNQTGQARTEQGIMFIPYDIPTNNWSNPIYEIDAYFSDCNGDGTIDSTDLNAIVDNNNLFYGNIPYTPPTPSTNDILQIITPNDTVGVDDEMLYIISFGDAISPKEDVLGIAYTISLSSNFLTYDLQLDYNIDNNWITGNDPKLDVSALAADESGTAVAQTRIDQQGQIGFGEVARLSGIIDEDLVGGFTQEVVPFQIETKDIIVSYTDRVDTIQGITDTIYIKKDLVDNTELNNKESKFKLYPNPVSHQLHLKTTVNKPIKIQVKNILGEPIQSLQWNTINLDTSWDVSHYPPGIYFLMIYYEEKRKTIKFMVE